MEDFKTWYLQHPFVSRTYLTGVIAVSLFQKLGLLSFPSLLFMPEMMIYKFQIWRFLTDYFVVGALSFHFIFSVLLIHFAFSRLELTFSPQNYADFLYLISYVILLTNLLAWIFGYWLLYRSLMFALIYIWCKRKPFETVTFYFGIKVQSQYFPWVLLGFHFVLGDDITQDLFGLVAGHSYIVLKDLLPVSNNKRFLETPKFFKNFVNKYVLQFSHPSMRNFQQQNQPQQQIPRFFQGQGVRLG